MIRRVNWIVGTRLRATTARLRAYAARTSIALLDDRRAPLLVPQTSKDHRLRNSAT